MCVDQRPYYEYGAGVLLLLFTAMFQDIWTSGACIVLLETKIEGHPILHYIIGAAS